MLKTLLKVLTTRLFCPFAGFLREVFDCVFNLSLIHIYSRFASCSFSSRNAAACSSPELASAKFAHTARICSHLPSALPHSSSAATGANLSLIHIFRRRQSRNGPAP